MGGRKNKFEGREEFEDIELTCTDCTSEFIFTAGEQQFFETRGFSEPKRCQDCRAQRKREKEGNKFNRGY